MQTAAEMIAYVESIRPGSTEPGKKRGNTKFTANIEFKHVPSGKVVVVTAASVHPDSFNMALVPEFATQKNEAWWRPVSEFAVP